MEEETIEVEEKKLTRFELEEAVSVLSKAFEGDALFNAMLSNKKELLEFIRISLNYYNLVGEIHLARTDGNIVGVSVWNPLGTSIISVRNLFKYGQVFQTLYCIFKFRLNSLFKIKMEYVITESRRYRGEHNYLYLIGSVKRGAGSRLLEFACKKFTDAPIYLEDSCQKLNSRFYKKFGFVSIGCVCVFGVKEDLLKREVTYKDSM